MLNIGAGELAIIFVAALLVLGPKRLPELARGLGKFLREFRRQTDDVRTLVEREFYRMDQDLDKAPEPPRPHPPLVPLPPGAEPAGRAAPLDPSVAPTQPLQPLAKAEPEVVIRPPSEVVARPRSRAPAQESAAPAAADPKASDPKG